MKEKNVQALENLSLFCHFSGVITLFIGAIIISLEFFSRGIAFIQAGLYVLATGYALVKISERISNILLSEKN